MFPIAAGRPVFNHSHCSMKTTLLGLVVLAFSIAVSPLPAGEETSDSAAASQATYERLVRVTTDYDLLLEAVGRLNPEAFEQVGLYRIEPGDTGMKIAKKHAITISILEALNPEVDWKRLRVWQVVRVRPESQKDFPSRLPATPAAQHPTETPRPEAGAPQH